MTHAKQLFAHYLRQRQEIGERELFVDSVALERLRSAPHYSAVPEKPLDEEPARPPPMATAEPQRVRVERGLLVNIESLDALADLAHACTACGLASTRANVVFSDGTPSADLVVVGEAPGADEDREGRPFVGRAGKMLDSLLAAIGFPRETVYICNVLKCRPPKNRNPLPEEVQACDGFLRGQLRIVGPKAILAVGTFAAQTILESSEPIGRLRGAVHEYEGIPVVPTYHPAALLRNSAWIRPVWEDLQRLRTVIDRQLA